MPIVSHRTKGILLTTLGIMAATPDGLFMRLADMEPWTVIFYRGLMLAFAINLWIRITTGRHAVAAWRKAGLWDAILMISFACTGPCYLFALSMTSVANVLVVTGLAPVVTAILGGLLLREKVTRRAWVAIAIAVLGAVIITAGEVDTSRGQEALTHLTGILFSFLTALCIAVQTIACRKLPNSDTRASVVAGALMAAVFAAPFASPLTVEAAQLAYVGAVGLLLMPIAIVLVFTGTRYINAYEVVVISLLEVVFGPLLVWLVIGEVPGMHTLAGGALILIGIAACFCPKRPAEIGVRARPASAVEPL